MLVRSRSLVDSGFKKTSYNGGGKTKPNQTPRLPAPLCCTPGAGWLAWSDPAKLSRGAGVGKAAVQALPPSWPGRLSRRRRSGGRGGGEDVSALHPSPPSGRQRIPGRRRAAASSIGTRPWRKPRPPFFTRARPAPPRVTHPPPRWPPARCGWSRRTS